MHLFEFCDQSWLPKPWRTTWLEILETCGSVFSSYTAWVCEEVLKFAVAHDRTEIVEIGAGAAPITRALAASPESDGLRLIPCDLIPETKTYRELQDAYPDKVSPIIDSVDLTQPHEWSPSSLLVLSCAFNQVPPKRRASTMDQLTRPGLRVMVFEAVRPSAYGLFCCALVSLIPGLALPWTMRHRPGFLRRATWCWLLPIVPLMYSWDTFVALLRNWSARRWRQELEGRLDDAGDVRIEATTVRLLVSW